jgi:PQQ-dependent catabolism-associated CXXCW motif protein
MRLRSFVAIVLVFGALPAFAAEPDLGAEDRNWGIAPTREIKQAPYSAPTPLEVPGARLVSTEALRNMVAASPAPLLLDVAGGDDHVTLKGAVWLPNAGRGAHFFDPVQAELAERLSVLSGQDKAKPLVFFCVNALCWLSYNASLRAVSLGYTRVHWYRGGIQSWIDAGLPTEKVGAPSK